MEILHINLMIKFNRKDLEDDIKYGLDYLGNKEMVSKFINNHIDLINKNNYDELFKLFDKETDLIASVLTEVLLLSGIDPLEYMTKVPTDFIRQIPLISITLPKNIMKLDRNAFAFHNLNHVFDRGTYSSGMRKIYYNGNKEDFENINKERDWHTHIDSVVCHDEEVYV